MSSTVLTAERADFARPRFRRASAIPGFGLAFGYTLLYLGLIVLLPLSGAGGPGLVARPLRLLGRAHGRARRWRR